MRASIVMALVCAIAAGCAPSKPCEGVNGACIALHVEGSVTGLDQLAISVDQPLPLTRMEPTIPAPLTLPEDFALVLIGPTFSPTVQVEVDGMAGGATIAQGAAAAVLDGKQHGSVTITLEATAPQPGVDMTAPPSDMTAPPPDDLALGGDMACSNGTCNSGDGCCPAGCNNNNDTDCPAVCGNGVPEAGEACDDGNSDNDDKCDPTCQFANNMQVLSGTPGSRSFADGVGTNARFFAPSGITSDGTSLYIVDELDDTVRQLNLLTNTVTTIAGQSNNWSGADGPVATAGIGRAFDAQYIHNPADNSSSIYMVNNVPDASGSSKSVLRRIRLDIGTVETIANIASIATHGLGANGTTLLFFGQSVSGTDPGLIGYDTVSGQMTLIAPFTAFTGAVLPYCTPGNPWAPSVSEDPAQDVVYNPDDKSYYVIRNDGNCLTGLGLGIQTWSLVFKVTPPPGGSGNATVSLYAGTYWDGSTFGGGCADGAANAARFLFANSISYANGSLSVTDCNSVRQVTSSGVQTLAGTNVTAVDVDGDQSVARLLSPYGLIALNGGIYVADTLAGTIRWIASQTSGVNVSTIAGVQPNTTLTYSTNRSSNYAGVYALTSDGQYLYTADSRSAIARVSLLTGTSNQLHQFSTTGVTITGGVLLAGTLYVALSDGTIHTLSRDGTTDQLYANVSPAFRAMATDGTSLYAVDDAHQIRAIANHIITTIAGAANTTDIMDGTGSGAHFASPAGLAYRAGTLYTTDGNGTVLRAIDVASGAVTTIAGTATMVGTSDGVGPAARFQHATSVATDGNSLFVTDGSGYGAVGNSDTIREIELPSMRVTTMIGTPGQFAAVAGVGAAAHVNLPASIVYDQTVKKLYFVDANDHTIQSIQ